VGDLACGHLVLRLDGGVIEQLTISRDGSDSVQAMLGAVSD
jgi:hypothetical protein